MVVPNLFSFCLHLMIKCRFSKDARIGLSISERLFSTDVPPVNLSSN